MCGGKMSTMLHRRQNASLPLGMRAAANIRIWFPTEECGAEEIRTVFCGDNIFQCCCALALKTTLLIFPSFSWLSVAYRLTVELETTLMCF